VKMFDDLRMDGATASFLFINLVSLYLEFLKGEKDRRVWLYSAAVAVATMAWAYQVNAFALVMLSGCRLIVSYRNHKLWERDSEAALENRIAELEGELAEERDVAFDLMRRLNSATDDRHERRSILITYEMRCRDNEVPCDDLVERAKALDSNR
jgi:hypothetical protein